jgi:Reverse transcriptase (RNA-dependent DNA polymerase)
LTDAFDLGKGHAQGDSPSPLLFNFAQQIMLFKLELDPEILKVRPQPARPHREVPEKFSEAETNYETDKCDGFADDNYTFTIAEENSIRLIFKHLQKFEILTGLKCNVSKTNLMHIGPVSADIVDKTGDLNVIWTNEIKMLGFYMTNDWTGTVNKNLAELAKKIVKIVNYWKRYGLSLIERITVYKSLILPHLNFFLSIFTPGEGWCKNVTEIIDRFVVGSEIISKKKIYLPVKEGGLGLTNLQELAASIQCTWVKKGNNKSK